MFLLLWLLSIYRASFSHSFWVGLLMTKAFRFLSPENVCSGICTFFHSWGTTYCLLLLLYYCYTWCTCDIYKSSYNGSSITLFYSPLIPGIVSTRVIFHFYTCVYNISILLHSFLCPPPSHRYTPQTGPVLPSSFLFLKKDTGSFTVTFLCIYVL
jgi:hypothetical protein